MLINIIVIIFFTISIYLTFKYRFIQRKAFAVTKRVLLKEKSKTSYQTLMVSLASHIGTGNIIGIATAIIYGGIGSIFWMWIYAIFSSIYALIENTLGQIYKKKVEDEYRGGSCYYTKFGLNKKVLPLFFALFMILTNTILFQPIQVNTVIESVNLIIGIDKIFIWFGLFLFIVFVVFRGTRKIIKFSEIIVPFMSIGYLIVSIIIIIMNIKHFPTALLSIFKEAFNFKSIFSGAASSCFLIGIKRSMFSHEAGLGTMPTISSMDSNVKPIEQGYIQVFNVFIDTIVLCSLTGFVIILNKDNYYLYEGCDLIIDIYVLNFGNLGKILCLIFLLTFAIATIVGEYYLGESNMIFLCKNKKNKIAITVYKMLFIIGTIIGTFFTTKSIFNIIDISMAFIGIFNIYVLFRLRKEFEIELSKMNC